MQHRCRQHRVCASLHCLHDMVPCPDAARGNDRDRDGVCHGGNELEVASFTGAVAIPARQENFPRT
jgi:hypothetical protein